MKNYKESLTSPIKENAITWRAFFIGLCVSTFVNLASPYTESVGFSNFSWSYLPEGSAIPLIFVIAINVLVKCFGMHFGLNHGEIILIFVMALVANSTSIWLVYFFLAAIISPEYFASLENEWQEILLPYIPKWLIIQDQNHAVRWFYEGSPSGASIPWKSWLMPLACWTPFFVALLLVSYTLIIFFRKQWIDHEKLAYPLMQPIIHLSETSIDGQPLWKKPLLLYGAIIPLFMAVMDIVKHINPKIPSFPMDHLGSLYWGSFTNAHGFSSLVMCVNFVAIGIGYFVPQDVLISIWLLYLIIKVGEVAILSHTGKWFFSSGGMFIWGNAAIAWQSFGAFVVFVILMIYRGRNHLAHFFRLAITSGKTENDELMSPRKTLLIFILGIAFMVFWLMYFSMPIKVVLIFMPLLLLIYLGIARVVCQSGIFYIVPPMIAQNPAIMLLTPRGIGIQGMISLGLTYSWHGDVQSVLSGLSAEGIKLQRTIRCTGKQLTIAIISSVMVGLFVAPWGVILTGYKQGALNWNTWLFSGFGVNTYGQILGQIQSGSDSFDWIPFVYFGIGSVLMIIMSALYYRYLWWPIHPIGLAVISSFTLYAVYIGFFIAWLAKHLILRWGGPQLYKRFMPFFIGLLIGHYIGRGIALITYTLLGLRFT